MNICKRNLLLCFLLMLLIFAGCSSRKPEPLTVVTPLADRLDVLFNSDPGDWEKLMQGLVESGRTDIPDNHLLYAIKEWNDVATKQICIKATYLYLDHRATVKGGFYGEDEELFKEYVEMALKDTALTTLARVDKLCRKAGNNLCGNIK